MMLALLLAAIYLFVVIALELVDLNEESYLSTEFKISRQLEILGWPVLFILFTIGGLICGILVAITYILGQFIPSINLGKKGN